MTRTSTSTFDKALFNFVGRKFSFPISVKLQIVWHLSPLLSRFSIISCDFNRSEFGKLFFYCTLVRTVTFWPVLPVCRRVSWSPHNNLVQYPGSGQLLGIRSQHSTSIQVKCFSELSACLIHRRLLANISNFWGPVVIRDDRWTAFSNWNV